MKKIIILTISLLLTTLSYSQDIRFSFLANPQLTWLSGNDDNYQANGSFPALNIGLEMDYFFSENYAFSSGLTIHNINGGAIYDDSLIFDIGDSEKVLPPDSRMRYNLQYISIPLGMKFKTIEIGYSRYFINTGITPMVLIRSRVSDETDTFNKTQFRDKTSLFNMNYFIEGGMEYSLGGSTAIIAGLGYYSGFTDVTKNSSFKLTTRGFAIILGVQF